MHFTLRVRCWLQMPVNWDWRKCSCRQLTKVMQYLYELLPSNCYIPSATLHSYSGFSTEGHIKPYMSSFWRFLSISSEMYIAEKWRWWKKIRRHFSLLLNLVNVFPFVLIVEIMQRFLDIKITPDERRLVCFHQVFDVTGQVMSDSDELWFGFWGLRSLKILCKRLKGKEIAVSAASKWMKTLQHAL